MDMVAEHRASMRAVTLHSDDMTARILAHGARLASLTVPDADGRPVDVALGLADEAAYRNDDVCMGAVVGRNAGRIAGARCVIDGKEYPLAANDGPNNSHSGPHGFEHEDWIIDEETLAADRVTLRLISPHLSQGFPGTLRVEATYALVGGRTLELTIEAQTDCATVWNPTSHIYWNLNGDGRSALGHTLRVNAGRVFPSDETFLPLDPMPVDGTPFDLREGRRLRDAMLGCDGRDATNDRSITDDMATAREAARGTSDGPDFLSALTDSQLVMGRGYNHVYDFARAYAASTATPFPMATLTGERSGIRMELSCNAPALVLYSAGFFDHIPTRNGLVYGPSAGIALEPSFVPNAINDTHGGATPSPLLGAGERRRMTIRWQFSA